MNTILHATAGYSSTSPGETFRPKMLPAAIALKVDDFTASPIADHLSESFTLAQDTANGIFFLPPAEQTFKWRSSQTHHVRRVGFHLTHANYLTSTASQGRT